MDECCFKRTKKVLKKNADVAWYITTNSLRTALEQFVVEDQWINLLHKLPIQGQGVLVALSSGAITIAYLTFNKEWQLFGDINKSLVLSDDDYITHWMPLPTTPTKGGKKQ